MVEVFVLLALLVVSGAALILVPLALRAIGIGVYAMPAGVALAGYALKFPWSAFLKYYKYEAQTLRPITDEKAKHDRHPD